MSTNPSQGSSLGAHVRKFIKNTPLSDHGNEALFSTSQSLDNFGLTPQINFTVQNMPSTEPTNRGYQQKLLYMPNAEFANDPSVVGLSVPNTFEHKSHPNARTKDLLGPDDDLDNENSKPSSTTAPVKTSTLRGLSVAEDEVTPSWMPLGLDHKWADNLGPMEDQHEDIGLDFLNSASANTFIHNTRHEAAAQTPMWKRLSNKYQANESPLPQIFPTDDGTEDDKHLERKPSISLISTPVAARDSDHQWTQQQIGQLEDMLEQAKDKPDDYLMSGLPLKLFGNEYDTFTKAVLTKFVENVRSNANSVQREEAMARPPLSAPKLKIKNFTKSGAYTDQDFMKNANNLFQQIQQKGYNNSNVFNNQGQLSPTAFQASISHNTATSTPKPDKIRGHLRIASFDEYSPYSTDFEKESLLSAEHESSVRDNDYTSYDKTNFTRSHWLSTSTETVSKSKSSSYTNDIETDVESEASHVPIAALRNSKVRNTDKADRNSGLPAARVHSGLSSESPAPLRWKRLSQLKLSNSLPNAKRTILAGHKGTVHPGAFPERVGSMIFDNVNNRWVHADKENQYPDSLASIEDLSSNEHSLGPTHSDTKSNVRARKNLEVSFQSPIHSSDNSAVLQSHNVTRYSDLQNVTFSTSNKDLLSKIISVTNTSSWQGLTSIDLSGQELQSVEDLRSYLPDARRINLSRNKIKYIDGIPSEVYELDVSANEINDLTSFEIFRDLEILDASSNYLKSLSSLSGNSHLNSLDLSFNQIRSFSRWRPPYNLTSLSLMGNNLSGEIDLGELGLTHLQTLNLAENSLTGVSGIELLTSLRVLNLNDNELTRVQCSGTNRTLKKLSVKFNRLTTLDVRGFHSLRVLRIDENRLESIQGLDKLRHLQEVSAKCQMNDHVLKEILTSAVDVSYLDLSGNGGLVQILNSGSIQSFSNVNELILSACGFSELPSRFAEVFPNVRKLTLAFNKLKTLDGLGQLRKLRLLSLLSNNLVQMENIITGLRNTRSALRSLDLRLNVINFDLYPYVFSPHELELGSLQNANLVDASPIQLDEPEDIENFSIHCAAIARSKNEWQVRDASHFDKLRSEGKTSMVNRRVSYEKILINCFPMLKELDGGTVNAEKRAQMKLRN